MNFNSLGRMADRMILPRAAVEASDFFKRLHRPIAGANTGQRVEDRVKSTLLRLAPAGDSQ
jgi:hypothetical protein